MKLCEIFNNYPPMYLNVPPPYSPKPSGKVIAAVLRSIADDQGNKKTEVEGTAQASKLWPNDKSNHVEAKDIVRKSKQALKKRKTPTEFEMVADQNKAAREIGSIVYR